MVTEQQVVDELRAFGLTARRDLESIRGALTSSTTRFGNRDVELLQGPIVVITPQHEIWSVSLGFHHIKWPKESEFNTLNEAVAFVKEVYSDLPELLANGWKPNTN